MNTPCPRHCDCTHPSECLFSPPEPERPSAVMLWIFGGLAFWVIVAVVLIVVL